MGTKKRSSWGINNLKYLNEIENLITIPHPSDYLIGKFNKSVIIPKNRKELNQLLHLCDIVISDISSIILEAALLNKTTIQLKLKDYPGTFPNIEINDKHIFVSNQLIKDEINNTDLNKKPFKISFLDEEMIVDFTSSLKEIKKTVKIATKYPNKHIKQRKFWVNECCWNGDGKTNERIFKMISNYIIKNEIKQLN